MGDYSMKHLSWLCLILLTPSIYAYELSGQKWPSPEVTMAFDIVNTKGEAKAPNGQTWNSAVEEAAQRWNTRTGFTFHTKLNPALKNVDVCQDDEINSVQFRLDDCGFEFGSTVLALTLSLFIGEELIETDIEINDNEPWDIYSGKVRADVSDFRRVAAHELGHVIGLEHEDKIPSLMDSFIADTEFPLKDDIQGASTIYSLPMELPDGCQQVTPLTLNQVTIGNFDDLDCRKLDLTNFVTDQAPVDLYRINLPTSGTVVIHVNSEAVADNLLALFDGNRTNLITYATKNGGENNSYIVRDLSAGSYQLAVTSASSIAVTGDYALQVFMNGSGPAPAQFDKSSKSIIIDSANLNGTFYRATLEWYKNPNDPKGMYWKLATFGPATNTTPGVTVFPNMEVAFHPVEAFGRKYDAVLERYKNPDDLNGLYWRLKSVNLRP